MKSVRVVLAVVALLALPFGSVAAQGNSAANKCKNDPQAGRQGNSQAGAAAVAVAQANKCPTAPPPPPPPPPPPSAPPTGVHSARGVVYEDVDGNGVQDVFAGEIGLAGWTIQLYWDGQLVSSATSDADGNYVFSSLGNSNQEWWVCVIPQPGYVRTQPASGTACGGNGMVHNLNSPFMTWLQTDFGEMIQ